MKLLQPEKIYIITETGRFTPKKNGNMYFYNDITVSFAGDERSLEISVTADSTPLCGIEAEWKCGRTERVLGDAFERAYGDLSWKKLANAWLPWYFFERDSSQMTAYGVMTGCNSLCFWKRRKNGIVLKADLRCGANGVILKNRRISAASVICESYPLSGIWNGMKDFCRKMCPNPILPAEPVYGGNNWYYAYGKSSHKQIVKDAELIAGLCAGLENRPFMVVDDCWQVCRTDDYIGGPWDRGNGDFPDMKGLAAEITALNGRPGIWYRPLWNRDAAIPDKCRLMRKKDIIDPSVPESLEIIAEDVKRFSAWGYQLIKYDFPTYDIFGRWGFKMKRDVTAHGWHFRDRTKTSAEIIKGLYKTIFENSNGAYLIGCNCIGHLAAGYVHINRIGDDISGKKFSRTRKMGVNSLAFRLCQHKTFYEADADCIGITRRIPWAQNRRWLRLLSESGTPFFVSASRDACTDAVTEDLKKAFRIASVQETDIEPVDWLNGERTPQRWRVNGKTEFFPWKKQG